MHRMVATVFKILFFSLILMFLLDTSLLMIQVISIHSTVVNLASVMQTEIARNNCMPEKLGKDFDEMLTALATQYNTGQRNSSDSEPFISYKSNLLGSVEIDGTNYESLNPNALSHVNDYGSFVKLAINVTIRPMYAYFSNSTLSTSMFPININYIYSVPCLRYLK